MFATYSGSTAFQLLNNGSLSINAVTSATSLNVNTNLNVTGNAVINGMLTISGTTNINGPINIPSNSAFSITSITCTTVNAAKINAYPSSSIGIVATLNITGNVVISSGNSITAKGNPYIWLTNTTPQELGSGQRSYFIWDTISSQNNMPFTLGSTVVSINESGFYLMTLHMRDNYAIASGTQLEIWKNPGEQRLTYAGDYVSNVSVKELCGVFYLKAGEWIQFSMVPYRENGGNLTGDVQIIKLH